MALRTSPSVLAPCQNCSSPCLRSARTWAPVNLDRIQAWVNQGRLASSPARPITARELLLSGCVHDAHDGVKLLGNGAARLTTPIHIVTSRASKSAVRAVEAQGGSVFCKHYNPLALRDCLRGISGRLSAAPTRKPDIRASPRIQICVST